MPISTADRGKLLLTPDLLQKDARYGLSPRKLDDAKFSRLNVRFPPIEDVVCALDYIASRESAA